MLDYCRIKIVIIGIGALFAPIASAQTDVINNELSKMLGCVLVQCQTPDDVTPDMIKQCMSDETVLDPEKYQVKKTSSTTQVLKMAVIDRRRGPINPTVALPNLKRTSRTARGALAERRQ